MAEQQEADYKLEYRISRTRLQQSYLLGGFLMVIGVIVFFIGQQVIPDATLIAIGHVVVAGGVIGYSVRLARDPRPRLVLDGDGVWYRDWNTRPIPWEQIRSVTTTGSRMSSFVCIELRDEQTLLHIIPEGDRQKFKANRLVRLPKLFIPNNSVDASFVELVDAIKAGLTHFAR
ncbi:MAG: PH domain-containing protein [Proteobacteria bacterium]|nr:PH domain-containing protein [Pseudomonadota bacterium]